MDFLSTFLLDSASIGASSVVFSDGESFIKFGRFLHKNDAISQAAFSFFSLINLTKKRLKNSNKSSTDRRFSNQVFTETFDHNYFFQFFENFFISNQKSYQILRQNEAYSCLKSNSMNIVHFETYLRSTLNNKIQYDYMIISQSISRGQKNTLKRTPFKRRIPSQAGQLDDCKIKNLNFFSKTAANIFTCQRSSALFFVKKKHLKSENEKKYVQIGVFLGEKRSSDRIELNLKFWY
ncbi:hypothetical protein BpHYR1_013727 [Brachionus plicatilis]|uniref:Uncharacterized protein n=1 Tax=Brachionus plicatilis TaxID=10195 RepID=A0A3M7PAH3_BRAPC|nr:hypothetical protein BpHYR1_013727 [Brachionus plicatilis]